MKKTSEKWLEAIKKGRDSSNDLHGLPSLPWIRPKLPMELASLIERIGITTKLHPGQKLPNHPINAGSVVLVKNGVLGDCIVDSGTRTPSLVAISPPGRIAYGLYSIFNREITAERCIALTEAEIVFCTGRLLRRLFDADHSLFETAVEHLVDCLISDRLSLACMSLLDTELRLLSFLAAWSANYGSLVSWPGSEGAWIRTPRPLPYTVQSRIIGSTASWTRRISCQWARDGACTTPDGETLLVRPRHIEGAWKWLSKAGCSNCGGKFPASLASFLES